MPRIAKPKKQLTNSGTLTKKELYARARRFCLWCCGNQNEEVQECQSFSCQWWDIRLGNTQPMPRPNYPTNRAELADNHNV